MKANGLTFEKTIIRRYLAETMPNTDYADDLALLPNTHAHVECLQHSLEQEAEGISLYVNANKRSYHHSKWQTSEISNNFTYLGSNISSTESDVNIRFGNALTASDWMLSIWKSDLSDKIKLLSFKL